MLANPETVSRFSETTILNILPSHVFALLGSESDFREEKQGCLFQFLESLTKRKQLQLRKVQDALTRIF